MDNEQPHQELVKCVVVGDTAVGKTRLICARACNKRVSLEQLLTTHVPTVWAIDQYRIYKDVLEQSWEVVDGVNVSLRLWDTFGDHEKDRRFAYGRSDVVLLCFSITNPVSLRNCQAMWYPEIRRFCPQTPVLLVGCKNDLRYMYRDEEYLRFFRDRSPFVRPTRKADLVMPDQARSVANQLGLTYYETSVLTHFGVNEVFENAIRAALIARRQQRFWMTNLKKVQRPLLQMPFRPPPPPKVELSVVSSLFEDHMGVLLTQQAHTDVVFVAGSVGFVAHRFLLAAASPALQRLLCSADPVCELTSARSSSETSLASTFGESVIGDFNDDTELLIDNNNRSTNRLWDLSKRRSSCQVFPSVHNQRLSINRELNHPAFQSIRIEQCDSREGRVCSAAVQTVVTLTKLVSPLAMQQCLKFLYTGTIDTGKLCEIAEIRLAAEFMELPELLLFVTNIERCEEFLNAELKQQYRKAIRARLRSLCLGQGVFSDVRFKLDDGLIAAHKALLMARCDVMRAMFSGDFRESAAKVVEFPGVKEESFSQLLHFLYTDECPPGLSRQRCVELLELANRLCLPRLTNLVEARMVREMQRLVEATAPEDITETCLQFLESCKLHNADQLADWCMNHLCTNYNKICKSSPKLLKALHPENQAYLSENRYPPVWFVKDFDYYQKCMLEREREDRPALKALKRSRHNSGCLCFSGKSRRDSDKPLVSSSI